MSARPLKHCASQSHRRLDRCRKLVVSNAVSDHSVRVRGDIRRVFKYLSDVRHYSDFDTSIVDTIKLGGRDARVNVGTRFQVVHSPLPGISIPVTYEVAEFVPHKRLVLTGSAESFSSTKTLALMTHPAQKEFTVVRQIVDIKMKDWKSFIPMLDSQLAKREEASISNMEKMLNASGSPLNSLQLDSEDMKAAKRATTSSSGSYNSLDLEEQTDRLKNFGSMLGNFFNGTRSNGQSAQSDGTNSYASSTQSYSSGETYTANGNGASSNGYSTATPTIVLSDPLGYYQVLGLDTSKSVSEDDIKAAFRAAAQQLHPDKLVTADERTKKAAKIQFQILQAAYSTLKDPVKRNMYDRGQLTVGSDA